MTTVKTKNAMQMLSLGLTMLALTACGGGGGGGGSNNTNYNLGTGVNGSYGQNCTNCFQNPQVILSQAQTANNSGISGSMDVLVPGANGIPLNAYQLSSYSGQVALQGYLSLPASSGLSGGTYYFNTQTVGTLSYNTISQVVLQSTTNGVTVLLYVQNALLPVVSGASNRLPMNISALYVNGQYLGSPGWTY